MAADQPVPRTQPDDDASPRPDGGSSDAAGPGQPLPPIPDGGLAAAMPDWLRASPTEGLSHSGRSGPAEDAADFSTILTDDDLPEWLRRFGDRAPRPDGAVEEDATPEPVRPDGGDSSPTARPRHGHVEPKTVQAGSSVPLQPLPERVPPPERRRPTPLAIGMVLAALLVAILVLAFG